MKQHLDELSTIASNSEPPTFENTIAPFDRSGRLFYRVNNMFDNLCSSNSPPELQAVELKMASHVASHYNKITSLPGLFHRINTIYESRLTSGEYTAEQLRLIERFHLDFVRSGAMFSEEDQKRYAAITEKLAELCTIFTQNVLTDESEITLDLKDTSNDLLGLPNDLIACAKQAAIERNKPDDTYVITLSRSLVEPFITFSERADLREKAWRLWTKRGELDSGRDNLAVAKQILQLRVEQAGMHGYKNYAEYATADTMAGNPDNVMQLVEQVWVAAKQSVEKERKQLESFIILQNTSSTNPSDNSKLDGTKTAEVGQQSLHHHDHDHDHHVEIHPWDWRFYAEKVRKLNYDLDEKEIKPYFSLTNMCQAIFDCANQLFNLDFILREDLVAYHPDVQVYEVREKIDNDNHQSRLVAIFLHDNYARPNKKGGAWMSEYRTQTKNTIIIGSSSSDSGDDINNDEEGSHVIPIIVNNNNFNKPSPGEPCLLSFDDAVTLFHEFGHGLHGMLSDVTYQRLAGTSVLRDFVELPSQLYEHWLSEPTVLKKHARHYLTNEPIPDELMIKLKNAKTFGEGFGTIEYNACVLVDIALHKLTTEVAELDITKFEHEELGRLGMPSGIVMRHRPAHFAHLFAGSGYASAYYVYLWAAVLDADGFDAFKETGDCFDRSTADRVRKYIYSSGNSLNPAEAYRLFRGRDPVIEPMLKQKGLLAE